MAIEYNFTLDMDRSKRDNNIAYARTGDVDSITINADLVLNGTAYTPTGTNAFFECITPNGHSIRAAAEKTGSTVSVEVPSAAFQAAGVINVAYFRFESGEVDNPTYVESTEPFAIVVREGIGDNIDAGDYIEEWRALADEIEVIVSEVEQKATQAEAAIDEQKAEVDQLKAQAQTSIAQDTEDVSDAKDTALSNINSSQGAVDAAIDQLEEKTQEAVDAAQAALDGTLAADIEAEVGRTLKLDVADMVEISSNVSLSSLTGVGSYCCKTAIVAAAVTDSPVQDVPFNMYVFSSAVSGQVMQLVVPIDLHGKPTAEWHVRFGTSSAMDPWSVIGGGADITAGLGIDVTGDAQKTVSIDKTAFYQHHEAADIIQGSTEVTGGGRFKELVVYGNTRQNLWVNPSGTKNGITATENDDGSFTIKGTATERAVLVCRSYILRAGSNYIVSSDNKISDSWATGQANGGAGFAVTFRNSEGTYIGEVLFGYGTSLTKSFAVASTMAYADFNVIVEEGVTVSGTYRVMLNEGSEAEPWCPPGLNGVEELSIVTAGKNIASVGEASSLNFQLIDYFLPAGEYTFSVLNKPEGTGFNLRAPRALGIGTADDNVVSTDSKNTVTFTLEYASPIYFNGYGSSLTMPLQLQLERGSTATAHEPPAVTSTPVDLDGHALNSLPGGTRDELRIDGTGAVTLVQRVGAFTLTDSTGFSYSDSTSSFYRSGFPGDGLVESGATNRLCNTLPVVGGNAGSAVNAIQVNELFNSSKQYVRIKRSGLTDTAGLTSWLAGEPLTALYPLVTPKEIDLPGIAMPDLASPNYTVFVSSNVPAEIEAEVVKVDYLPPSNVYTKQEVDKKIEAGSMPDIVPVSKGGTGVTTAAAERNRLGLGNTTGALPVANGGTGATTANAAFQSLHPGGIVNSVTDDDFLSAIGGSGWVGKAVNLANFWTSWIASKIRSTFGFNGSNVLKVSNGGTGATEPGVTMLSNLGITFGTADPPSTGTPGSIYIQYFE